MRNQDLPALEEIFDLLNECISVEKRSEWTYDRLFQITRRMSGMPGGGGNAPGMDGILAEVEELNEVYIGKLKRCAASLKKAERILNGIGSQRMRTFVQMVYVDRLSKAEVMREMDLSEYSFNRLREKIEKAESMAKVNWGE